MPLHAWSSARYVIPLPEGHRFPIAKYAMLRDRVLADGLVRPEHLHEPARASLDVLRLVHSERYLASVANGTLTDEEQRRIGFPWSPQLAERSREQRPDVRWLVHELEVVERDARRLVHPVGRDEPFGEHPIAQQCILGDREAMPRGERNDVARGAPGVQGHRVRR